LKSRLNGLLFFVLVDSDTDIIAKTGNKKARQNRAF
jgi:hypothetical protein